MDHITQIETALATSDPRAQAGAIVRVIHDIVYLRAIRGLLEDAERTLTQRECEALFDIVRRTVESQVRP